MKTELVTPRRKDGTRLALQVSPEDAAKVERGHYWTATVTDLATGLDYKLKGAACGIPGCFCDAVVIE